MKDRFGVPGGPGKGYGPGSDNAGNVYLSKSESVIDVYCETGIHITCTFRRSVYKLSGRGTRIDPRP
jgi:hypothetical protein